MPPNTGDGPLNTLEQMRDILAQILDEHRNSDGEKGEGETASGARREKKPDGEDKDKKKPRKTALDHGLGIMSGLGGAPAQLAGFLKQADSIGKSILEFGEMVGKWWNPPKKPEQQPIPTPKPVLPESDLKLRPEPTPTPQQPAHAHQQPAPLQPVPPVQQPPTVASPAPVAPVLATPTVPTPQPQQPAPTLATPTVPTIPVPQQQPRQEVPAITPPAVPVLPTKLDLAPVTPVPLPGLATDAGTRIPRAEREIQQPIGQTAPVLIPGAPGGGSGAAPSNDSARLAAALEKLVVFLDKMDKQDSSNNDGSGGDETEQGENFQRRSMWTMDHRAGSTPIQMPHLETPGASGTNEEKNEALKPTRGFMGALGKSISAILRGTGS